MDHPVAVGAKETKVPYLCLLARFQRVNGFRVMALDEALTAIPVPLMEVKPACLASKPPERFERTAFF